MNMTQLVIGTACGFLVAQAALYAIRRLFGLLPVGLLPGGLIARVRSFRPAPGQNFIGAFVKYAAPVGISAALVTFLVWAVGDYLAARSARNAAANVFDSSATTPAAEQGTPQVASAALTPPPPLEPVEEPVANKIDPYADPDFRVQRKAHRVAASLKETLVERSETRARNELLRELQQHARRSQYDCEAAARGDRYLKSGLDVWGFAVWQVKYFPADNYRGATLERCKDIKDVVASLDLQAAVAQQNPQDSER
ncbi:MAG: hypothetical protein ACLPQ6_10465 [Steroidobacteraceae bacterium]|jgi:hypothetical protein